MLGNLIFLMTEKKQRKKDRMTNFGFSGWKRQITAKIIMRIMRAFCKYGFTQASQKKWFSRYDSTRIRIRAGVSNSNPSMGHIWMKNVSAGRNMEKYPIFSGPHAALGPRVWYKYLILNHYSNFTIFLWPILNCSFTLRNNVLWAGWRQCPRGSLQRSWILANRPRREHPTCDRDGQALRGLRHRLHLLLRLTIQTTSRIFTVTSWTSCNIKKHRCLVVRNRPVELYR